MKKVLVWLLAVGWSCSAIAVETEKVPAYLQTTSVNVKSDRSQGSGSIVIRKIEGIDTAFILTAAHVTEGLRTITTIIDQDGRDKKVVSYRDASVLQERIENGQTVGEVRVSCRVVAVSYKNDIAILQVRWPGLYREGVEFDTSGAIPTSGTALFHCGSPGGQDIGFNSLTNGIMSATGRMIDMGNGVRQYDQITCPSLPGSSGGAVVRVQNGEYVGTLTLGLRGSDSFSWIVPIRRTITWANSVGLGHLFDPKLKPLTKAELDKIDLESGDDGKVSRESSPTSPPDGNVRKLIRLVPQQDNLLYDILTHRAL